LPDDWLSLSEAAVLSGLSASHLRLLARSGRIEARRFGRDWFTKESAVLAYLANEALRKKDPYKRRRGEVDQKHS
jgi:excisionase family DNA binding protein